MQSHELNTVYNGWLHCFGLYTTLGQVDHIGGYRGIAIADRIASTYIGGL